MKKIYRPGVYSQYDVVSRQKSYTGRYAFFCGGAKLKEGKNLPPAVWSSCVPSNSWRNISKHRAAAKCSAQCAEYCCKAE